MAKNSFIAGYVFIVMATSLAVLMPLYWATSPPMCSGMASLVCEYILVFVYPIILLITFIGNSLLLSRYFLVKHSYVYAWAAMIMSLGMTFIFPPEIVDDHFPRTAITVVSALLLLIIIRWVDQKTSNWLGVIFGLLIPVIIFSPWTWNMINEASVERNKQDKNETTAINKLQFNPYISPTLTAKQIYTKTDMADAYENSMNLPLPYIWIQYEQYGMYQFLRTQQQNALEVCKSYNQDRPSRCADKGNVLATGSVSQDHPFHYYIVTDSVVILLDILMSQNGNDALRPKEAEILKFVNSLKPVPSSQIKPIGY